MFTQCPVCHKAYPLSAEQLHTNSLIACSDCGNEFSAYELLTEKSVELKAKPKSKAKKKTKNRQQAKKNLPIDFNAWKDAKPMELESKKPTGLLAEVKAEFIPKTGTEYNDQPERRTKDRRQVPKKSGAEFKKNSLEATATSTDITPAPEEILPWETVSSPVNVNWTLGLLISSVVLIGQLIYFENGKWSQNTAFRPRLEKICGWLGCKLRAYKNSDELTVLSGSFVPKDDNTIEIREIINNQAAFNQPLPNIKLTLLDYNEQFIGQRVFTPTEYTSTTGKDFVLAPDATFEINFSIAAPETSIGGHTIEFTY